MKILILSGNGAFHIVERHARVGNRHRHRYASLEEKSPKGARCLDIVSTVPKSIAGRPPRNLVHVVVSLDRSRCTVVDEESTREQEIPFNQSKASCTTTFDVLSLVMEMKLEEHQASMVIKN